MNKGVSNFDLVASVMERLNISPSVLTLHWIREQALSFSCVAQGLQQKEAEQRPVGTFIARELCSSKTGGETLSSQQNEKPVSHSDGEGKISPLLEENTKPKPLGDAFYDENWEKLAMKFELNAENVSSLRCGMFAYLQEGKLVICQNPLVKNYMRENKVVFAGILLDLRENKLQIMRVVCEGCNGYGRVLKRMPSGYCLPSYEDCEKIFFQQEILRKAFKKQHFNFGTLSKFFFEDADCVKTEASIFNLCDGGTEQLPAVSAKSGSCCVRVFNIN